MASSSGYQCVSIVSKSEFVLEIKFGKISYESADIDCSDTSASANKHISQEFVYGMLLFFFCHQIKHLCIDSLIRFDSIRLFSLVDTNYGVKCPLPSGIYEKLGTNKPRSTVLDNEPDNTDIHPTKQQQQQPCKYLTQTQTLQVGCASDQQYSLKTKLCYPNQHQASAFGTQVHEAASSEKDEEQDDGEQDAQQLRLTTNAYTQLESEINLVCLAHWHHDGNQVIVSRTMTNEILCSVREANSKENLHFRHV